MLDQLGKHQQELVSLLHARRQGLTPEEIAAQLKLARATVDQEVWALERNGYLLKKESRITLTEKGENLFPKQYSWFSELLLDKVLAERGAAGLKEWMEGLASTVARDVQAKMTGETLPERLVEISAVMNELAYDASPKPKGTELAIEATNCVYHSVALKHPEVCQFDIQLLGELSGAKVVHEKCMIRGQDVCRFRFDPKKP